LLFALLGKEHCSCLDHTPEPLILGSPTPLKN